jgi:ribosomal protein S18 acetylase RimI-like enzyme
MPHRGGSSKTLKSSFPLNRTAAVTAEESHPTLSERKHPKEAEEAALAAAPVAFYERRSHLYCFIVLILVCLGSFFWMPARQTSLFEHIKPIGETKSFDKYHRRGQQNGEPEPPENPSRQPTVYSHLKSAVSYLTFSSSDIQKETDPIHVVTLSAHYIPSLRHLNSMLLPVYYGDRLYRDVLQSPRTCKLASYGRLPVGAITSRIEPLQSSYLWELRHEMNATIPPDSTASSDTSPASTPGSSWTFKASYLSANLSQAGYQEYHMYVMTIGVLPTYRRLGIGRSLVESLIQEAHSINAEQLAQNSSSVLSSSVNNDGDEALLAHQLSPLEKKALFFVSCIVLHVQENNDSAIHFYESLGFQKVHYNASYYFRIQPRGAYIMVRPLAA